MANITKTRRSNALALFQAFVQDRVAAGESPKGLESAFAEKLAISASLWSQIKGARPIGDKLARQIEHRARQAEGWLDVAHEDLEAPDPAEEHFVQLAAGAWRGADAKGKRELLRLMKEAHEKAA